jgi:23S rRNA (guanosine2251-2'-O)-methyltransferase
VIVYGRNPVREALRGRRARGITQVWVTASAAHEPWLGDVETKVCGADELERLCGSSAHQGVCADVGGYPYVGAHELLAVDSPLIVALDQVQDPQNLGSICRTAECAGATGVVLAERRAAEVTPAACKASAGAVEHMRIARVRNIADFLGEAREAGCWSYGASAPPAALKDTDGRRAGAGEGAATGVRHPGDPTTVPYTAPDYSGGVVLVLGSEGSGLRPRVAGACDQLVSLPLHGRMESLGVAAAAAALLYGILQGRRDSLDKAP